MRRTCIWISGLLLNCSLACVAATPPIQPTSQLASLLKLEAIDSSYVISYQDEHGKSMTEAAFSASITKGRSFNLKRDTSAHTATLILQSQGHELKLSPKEMATFDAASSGKTFLKPGQPLPPFQLKTADGHRVDNATLRGHVTLVNFFFSLCGSCIQETATLTAYANRHPRQYVLAVTFDDAKTAKAYIADHGFSWPVLVDAMAFDQAMGVNAYPTMALIGPDGHVLSMSLSTKLTHRGKALTVADLEHWVAAKSTARR